MNKEKIKSEATTPLRHPSKFLYWLLIPFLGFLLRIILKVKTHKDLAVKNIKGPFLALGTHSSALDFILMMLALIPHRLNIVCGRDLLTWKAVKPFIKYAGLIPMSQFSMDIGSIRLMKKAIDMGCNLSLFPEGKISLDGRQIHFTTQSIAKLVKFLNVPVVMCHNNGGYLSLPKWAPKMRRGRIDQSIKLLFTVQDLQTMKVNDIFNRIKSAFAYNDHIFQKENHIRFKTKAPAKGLHYLLYKCSKCGTEYEMSSNDHELTCNVCKNTIEYTEYGEMLAKVPNVARFQRIDQWYDYQRQTIKELVNDENFYETHSVVWAVSRDGKYEENGDGELFINTSEIGFIGKDLNGNPAEMRVPLKTLYTIVQKVNEAVDLTIDNVVHRFYFRDCRYSVKYTLIVEESHKRIQGVQ